jgi:hypothetical protein
MHQKKKKKKKKKKKEEEEDKGSYPSPLVVLVLSQ